MPNPNIEKLQLQLSEIESFIPKFETTNFKVSKVSVGWQLDHALKVLNGVMKTLMNSNPDNYNSDFNFSRMVLFGLNYIPRGKAKSPKIVLPPEIILKESLVAQFNDAKDYLEKMDAVNDRQYFKHFVFGTLSKKQTLRFLILHTHHHLKIIKDILKQ